MKTKVADLMKKTAKKTVEEAPKIDFNYISPPETSPSIPTHFFADEKWNDNLKNWFGHLRPNVTLMCSECEQSDPIIAIRSVESGEYPTLSNLNNPNTVSCLLQFFSKKESPLSFSDLFWLFGILVLSERYLSPEAVDCLQAILSRIDNQIYKITKSDDLMLPYLIVLHSLITKFFHK